MNCCESDEKGDYTIPSTLFASIVSDKADICFG